MTPGAIIAELREAKDMNQTELAKELEINRSVLNRIELGTRPIRDDELKKIAKYFHVSTDYILGTISPEELRAYMDEQLLGDGSHPAERKPEYFLDPETVRLANEMKENPGRRVLFDATRNLSPEKIKQVQDFVNFITRDQDFSE